MLVGESPQQRFIPVDETTAQQIIEIPPEIFESMNAFRNVDLSLRNNNVMLRDALCVHNFVIIAAIVFFSLNWPYSHSSTYRRTTTLPESEDQNLSIWNSSTGHCKRTLVSHDIRLPLSLSFPTAESYPALGTIPYAFGLHLPEYAKEYYSPQVTIGSPLSPYCLIAVLCPAQMAVYVVFGTHTPVGQCLHRSKFLGHRYCCAPRWPICIWFM